MMSTPQESSGRFLWWYLQSLDFHLEVDDITGNKNTKHLNLGVDMFDKPNKEAFYLVTYFLFKKLNSSRTQDLFRHCWPVLDRKIDAAFRKAALGWLQEIANEEENAFPKVITSHLLSPSGSRFVNLMLHLAKHVMVKKMKSFTTDGSWVPEAAAVPASTLDLEYKRLQMVKRKFQRATVWQDSLIQDYQRRARHLEKSLKDLKAEDAKYDDVLKTCENSMDMERELQEKISKARSLWTKIDEALASIEKERRVLTSVTEGKDDQFILDGKHVNVKIPRVLLERMERSSHQTSGNLYEEGQPAILRLFELLNVGLNILSEERAKLSVPTFQLSYQTLQEQALLMKRSKETLKSLRHRLVKEDIPHIKNSIKKLEEDWDEKWAECLKHTPLISFLKEDHILDFLSPMAPLCFEPASEAGFKSSIFSQYPAKLPDHVTQTIPEKPCSEKKEAKADDVLSRLSAVDKTEDRLYSNCFEPVRPVSPYVVQPKTPDPVHVPAFPTTPSVQVSTRRPSQKTPAVIPNAQILDLEYENLASQFAEAVTMSPVDGIRKNMELEQLLSTMSDPFTTREQLPRTPESLLMDVRTSWRKALEESKMEKKQENGHNSPSCLTTPVVKIKERIPSPPTHFPSGTSRANVTTLPHSPLVSEVATSSHSTATWDSSQLEALSQTSDVIQFSITHETFPGTESDDSFNSSSGQQEVPETECLLPSVVSCSPEATYVLKMPLDRHWQESPFSGMIKETDFQPSVEGLSPGLDSYSGKKVFSLDLEELERSLLEEELILPNLITFSDE